jgi:hypothetical protein
VSLSQIPVVDGLLQFDCPRCHFPVTERLYGPCGTCRAGLNEKFYRTPGSVPGPGSSRFEPKMNVVPNFVATKDDFDGPEDDALP